MSIIDISSNPNQRRIKTKFIKSAQTRNIFEIRKTMNKITFFQQIFKRNISISSILYKKKNFNKFDVRNKRGTRAFKKRQMTDPHPFIPVDHRGVREVGLTDNNQHFNIVSEMIPKLIVPNFDDCQLKPYVSYRAQQITQSEFKPEDLFNAVYANKIISDWNDKKLNDDGTSKQPSNDELLESDRAWQQAKKTGSDIF